MQRTRWKPNWREPRVETTRRRIRYGLMSCMHCRRPWFAMADEYSKLVYFTRSWEIKLKERWDSKAFFPLVGVDG